ncbi:MAG: TIM-barrel domain-containing protein [Myxococcota bacterium]
MNRSSDASIFCPRLYSLNENADGPEELDGASKLLPWFPLPWATLLAQDSPPAHAEHTRTETAHELIFRVYFRSGQVGWLHVQALQSVGEPQPAWHIVLAEDPEPGQPTAPEEHELRCEATVLPITLQPLDGGLECRVGCTRLEVGLEPPSLRLYARTPAAEDDAEELCCFETVLSDLNVGNHPQSFGFFRHDRGMGLGFGLEHGVQVYGGGGDFGGISKNGQVYDVLNSDALGVNGRLRYQSTPVFWMQRVGTAQGLLLVGLSPTPARVDVGARRHEVVSWSSTGPRLAFLLLPSASAEVAVGQLRRMTGQRCRGVPSWSLGLWMSRCYYRDQQEVEAVLASARQHELPLEVINLDARCWMRADTRTDFVWDTSRFEPFTTFIPRLRAQDVHVCLWENPYVSSTSELYQEGVSRGFFARTRHGKTYPLNWVPTGLEGFPRPPVAGLVDFTNPDAWAWWKDLHRPYLRAGVECFKTDFGEEIPPGARFADGSDGLTMRNVYSDLYNRCVMEVLQEEVGGNGLVWARSGWMRSAEYPVTWSGDSQSSWRGLRATLRAGLSQAVGGALFWSHDVGGFYGPGPDAELYLRWAQLGLWGSHVRCHGTAAREPWAFDSGDGSLLRCFRQALHLRLHLRSYFEACGTEAVRLGVSSFQPLWMRAPDEPATALLDDQAAVGTDVVIAPFLEKAGGRLFYLPLGTWRDLRSGEKLEGGRFHRTGRTRHLPAFARMGTTFEVLFAAAPSILAG